jgi:hypothetical protein
MEVNDQLHAPDTLLKGGRMGPITGLEMAKKIKYLLSLRGIELRFLGSAARSLVTVHDSVICAPLLN